MKKNVKFALICENGGMRLHFLILLTFMFIFSMQSYSKTVYESGKFSIKVKDANIVEVFKELENSSDYGFFFKSESLDLRKKYNLNLEEKSIDAILENILDKNVYNYSIVDKNIVITNKNLKQQSEKIIKGKVTDKAGEPLPGVSVMDEKTGNGVVTDVDGQYTIVVGADVKTLLFSFIGMKKQLIDISNRSVIDVSLVEDLSALDEVVVIGYGTQKKATLTGATTSIKTDNIEKISTANLSNTLAGRASGVTVVQNSGFAGSSSSIRIRGSFKEPLYVIDDVIRDKTAFDALDPDEVEEISILKDAAAASIYGMKAADGVVLVKTKGGGLNKRAKFSYKMSYSW